MFVVVKQDRYLLATREQAPSVTCSPPVCILDSNPYFCCVSLLPHIWVATLDQHHRCETSSQSAVAAHCCLLLGLMRA